jgi:hypothetical protein
VTDDQVNARARGRVDHRLALGERERHRLFHQHMLAGAGGCHRVLAMELVRARDIDRIDRRIGAQRIDCLMRPHAEIGLEAMPGFRPRIGGAGERDARIADERRQH